MSNKKVVKKAEESKLKAKDKVKPKFDFTKDIKNNKFKPKLTKGRIKNLFFFSPQYLINMQMRNGMHRQFFVATRSNEFRFLGGAYVIDTEHRYYNVDAKSYAFDYHQDFTLPIMRNIKPNELKESLTKGEEGEDGEEGYEVENAVNPYTLKEFLESKIAEGVMRGQNIDEYLRKMFMMVMISMFGIFLLVVISVTQSGVLDGLSIPFLG